MKLTKAELDALAYLEPGWELWPVGVARNTNVPPMARGNFCARFRRLYEKGAASIRVTPDAVLYRITPAGRSLLKGESRALRPDEATEGKGR